MDASFCVAKEAASVLPDERLQNSENFKRHKLHSSPFLLYLSDILGVINHYNCYLQGLQQHR